MNFYKTLQGLQGGISLAESGVDQLWEFGDGAATDAEDTSDADEDAQETSDENKSKASAKTKKKKRR